MSTTTLERLDTIATGADDIEHGACYSHPHVDWCGVENDGTVEDGYLGDDDTPCVVCWELDYCTVCGRDLDDEV